MIVRLLAGLVVAAVAALGSVIVAAPASAAALPLEYSLDGVTWSDTAPAIVPASWQPVPGSTLTAALHVRSTRGTDARVAIYLGDVASPSMALLTATTVTGRLAAFALNAVDGCRPLDSVLLHPGESAILTIAVEVAPSLAVAQTTPLTLHLDASMSDVQVTPVGVGCPASAQPGGGGELPATGNSLAPALAITAVGGALLFIGVGARRRAKRNDCD